ncbi:hypothetical protein [Parasitella parasitica]|uniref:Uncharacterized protein n=1 Tax=Parasitella parasitica TaxID=35722 RepID=A0A0B7NF54_9FUNG|nr:hypothetical protein [Parasitella parasitica]
MLQMVFQCFREDANIVDENLKTYTYIRSQHLQHFSRVSAWTTLASVWHSSHFKTAVLRNMASERNRIIRQFDLQKPTTSITHRKILRTALKSYTILSPAGFFLTKNIGDDDTIYDYPYQKQALLSSTPLYVNGTIFDRKVKVVIDSGSSISILSKSIAIELGLIGTGDRIPISTLDTTSTDHAKCERERDCEVTVAVPVRVGGKLRSEHMIIKDDSNSIRGEAVVLLGMTWLRQYDIKIHTKEALIEIPIKNGGSSILVQGWCTEGNKFAPPEVFAVSIYGGNSVAEEKIGAIDTTLNLDTLYNYIPDTLRSYLEEALPSDDEVAPEAKSKVEEDEEGCFQERLKDMPTTLAALLMKHKMQFSEFGGLGCIKGAEHRIQLKPGATPVRSRPYKITWEEDEFLREELDRLLALGVIRRSSGLWTSLSLSKEASRLATDPLSLYSSS